MSAGRPNDIGPRVLNALDRLGRQAWFAYGTLTLLQLKVVWDVWRYRDLTPGDEASYYNRAFLWFQHSLVDIAWSPLYTSFFGTLMYLSAQPYFVTILHRIVIVLALALMVLALMRRLLPHWLAWLMAAWWVVLPINYDAAFTVHLFAVLPLLAAWLVALLGDTPWARGGALALLLLTTVLVRNEYVVAIAIFLAVCVWWEVTRARAKRPAERWLRTSRLAGYGVPLALAVAVVVFFYARSVTQFTVPGADAAPQHGTPAVRWPLRLWLQNKHTLNMCQVYAYGYQQRHPEWTKSPWLDCGELMTPTFGTPLPSLAQMIRANPTAVLQHFSWNFGLTPSGVQLLLFNASAGSVNPDYAPATLRSTRGVVLSLVVGAILIVGGALLYADRRYWWEEYGRARAVGWLAMLSVMAVALVVIPTQRPRPSYLFAQGIAVMALVGLCLFAMSRRWPIMKIGSRALPIIIVAIILAAPNRYHAYGGPRPLLTLYERLAPFEAVFHRPDSVFLVSGYPMEVHGYVGRNHFTNPLVNLDYSALARNPADAPLPSVLDGLGVNLFYVDETLWRRLEASPTHRLFLDAPERSGWMVLGYQRIDAGRWMLLRKRS
jgi:hypothetical protein